MRTYSFIDTVSSLVGPGISVSLGYGAGIADEGITLERAGEQNAMTTGADGEGFHNLHAETSGHIIVRVLKTSPLNALLNAAYNFQAASASTWGQNTITVGNTGLQDASVGQNVAFNKMPVVEYNKDPRFNEWRFDAIKLTIGLG